MYKKFLDYVRAQFSDLAFKEMGPKPKFSLNSRIHWVLVLIPAPVLKHVKRNMTYFRDVHFTERKHKHSVF
jgi:hypothetical protein